MNDSLHHFILMSSGYASSVPYISSKSYFLSYSIQFVKVNNIILVKRRKTKPPMTHLELK